MDIGMILYGPLVIIGLGFMAGYLQQLVKLAAQILMELKAIRVAMVESNEAGKIEGK